MGSAGLCPNYYLASDWLYDPIKHWGPPRRCAQFIVGQNYCFNLESTLRPHKTMRSTRDYAQIIGQNYFSF